MKQWRHNKFTKGLQEDAHWEKNYCSRETLFAEGKIQWIILKRPFTERRGREEEKNKS